MRDLGIQKPFVQEIITDDPRFKNYYGLRKLIRDYLQNKLNVAVYDACCVAASPTDIFPMRYNADSGTAERFDGTDWIAVELAASALPLAITVDQIDEATLDAGVTIEGILLEDGVISNGDLTISSAGGVILDGQIASFYPQAAQNDIAAGAGGAISVANYFTTINTDAGGDAFTLADGTVVGQMKRIRLVVDGGGDGVVTPANLSGATTITFNDAGDDVELQWNGTDWVVLVNLGATIA